MSTTQTPVTPEALRTPNIQFRVLVLGRANAGKTSILQRVCDTTESPTIYRRGKYGPKEEVRGPHFVCESDLTADQSKLEPSMRVSDNRTSLRLPIDIVPARRARHRR
jgi:GTPase SAR1 family protein